MMKLLRSIKTDKRGASAAEYALIVAVMGGLVVAGAVAFGGSLSTAMTDAGTALEAQSTGDFGDGAGAGGTPPAPPAGG